jgi:hypothetical protein
VLFGHGRGELARSACGPVLPHMKVVDHIMYA